MHQIAFCKHLQQDKSLFQLEKFGHKHSLSENSEQVHIRAILHVIKFGFIILISHTQKHFNQKGTPNFCHTT